MLLTMQVETMCLFICTFLIAIIYAIIADVTRMRWPKNSKLIMYVEALHREIDIVAAHIDKANRRISQIHYGGGSPTSLPIHYIKELNEHLLSLMPTIEKPEIAIECHPGYLNENDWKALCEMWLYTL